MIFLASKTLSACWLSMWWWPAWRSLAILGDPVSPPASHPYPISWGSHGLSTLFLYTHTRAQATSIEDTPQFKGKDHKYPIPQLQRIHQSWTFSCSRIGERYKAGSFRFTRPEDLNIFFDDQKLSFPKCKPNSDIK